MKHADLIARLEKLTGPDREVDAAVWCQSTDGRRLRLIHDGAVLFEDAIGGFWVRSSIPLKSAKLPRFTASLDAAVALVERMLPGQEWSCGSMYKGSKDPWAVIRTGPLDNIMEFGPTPAIAILIALLKSMESTA